MSATSMYMATIISFAFWTELWECLRVRFFSEVYTVKNEVLLSPWCTYWVVNGCVLILIITVSLNNYYFSPSNIGIILVIIICWLWSVLLCVCALQSILKWSEYQCIHLIIFLKTFFDVNIWLPIYLFSENLLMIINFVLRSELNNLLLYECLILIIIEILYFNNLFSIILQLASTTMELL